MSSLRPFGIMYHPIVLLLRYTHIHTPLDDSTRPLDNRTNSTLHNPQRAGALVTSIILDGGPHGWVPINTHSTPVLPKWEEAVGSSQGTTYMIPITKGMEGPFTTVALQVCSEASGARLLDFTTDL